MDVVLCVYSLILGIISLVWTSVLYDGLFKYKVIKLIHIFQLSLELNALIKNY